MTGGAAADRPVLVFLHGLGCSAQTWRHVIRDLSPDHDCVALDLPGHGEATASAALTVEQMANDVIADLLVRRPHRWALVGHSMGGKIATIVTAALERSRPGIPPPFGLVLVASSPLTAEPMDETTREQMIGWRAQGAMSTADARAFIDANTAAELPEAELSAAVADVRRVSREAWLAWLERGSREDWSGPVDRVHTPTMVVAGGEDGDLGADAQRRVVVPRVAATDVVEVPDASHLVMLEQPAHLADLIRAFVLSVLPSVEAPPALLELIDSDRVSARTRQVLLGRLAPQPRGDQLLSGEQRATLTALLARVVPQRHTSVDLVVRIEQGLASRVSDGFRFAALPDDQEAWRAGLDTLSAQPGGFVGLDATAQDSVVHELVAGHVGSDQPGHLSADRMVLWFEDVRAAAVRAWMSHPSAMARIGYDGFANGGDGVRKQGYLRVGAGERESWQALPLPRVRRPGDGPSPT